MPPTDLSVPYVWCPEYTLRSVAQRILIVWNDDPRPVGTDYHAPNIDEAELVCTDLNKPLGYEDHQQWLPIAATYIRVTAKGAPVLLKAPDFKPWDRDAAMKAVDDFIPAYEEITKTLAQDPAASDLTADMLGELARVLDGCVAETDDNIALQQMHVAALADNPARWEPHHRFRTTRAGNLLEYFNTVRKSLDTLRAKASDTYEIVAQKPLELAPDFAPRTPEAIAATEAAASPILRV